MTNDDVMTKDQENILRNDILKRENIFRFFLPTINMSKLEYIEECLVQPREYYKEGYTFESIRDNLIEHLDILNDGHIGENIMTFDLVKYVHHPKFVDSIEKDLTRDGYDLSHGSGVVIKFDDGFYDAIKRKTKKGYSSFRVYVLQGFEDRHNVDFIHTIHPIKIKELNNV